MDPFFVPNLPAVHQANAHGYGAISADTRDGPDRPEVATEPIRLVREAIIGRNPVTILAPLIDRSPEARRARGEAARAAVARMEAIENDPQEDDLEFLRSLDQSHPGRFDLARYYADGPGLP